MPVKLIDRDVTKDELARMNKGFEEHDREQGAAPETGERLTVTVEDDGVFAGCASGLKYHDWFYLTDMWLEKPYRGKGWGAKALERLEELVAAAGAGNIYTWTRNYEAPAFYRKLGYEEFAAFENYYGPGLTRFGFCKKLDDYSSDACKS